MLVKKFSEDRYKWDWLEWVAEPREILTSGRSLSMFKIEGKDPREREEMGGREEGLLVN